MNKNEVYKALGVIKTCIMSLPDGEVRDFGFYNFTLLESYINDASALAVNTTPFAATLQVPASATSYPRDDHACRKSQDICSVWERHDYVDDKCIACGKVKDE